MSLVHYSEVRTVIKGMFGNSSASAAVTSAAAGGRPATILEQVGGWVGWMWLDQDLFSIPENHISPDSMCPRPHLPPQLKIILKLSDVQREVEKRVRVVGV